MIDIILVKIVVAISEFTIYQGGEQWSKRRIGKGLEQ